MKPERDGKATELMLGDLEIKLLAYLDEWQREFDK